MPGLAGVTVIDTSVARLIIIFLAVTVPLRTVRVPLIAEYELFVEKLVSYPPIRANDTLLLKLSSSSNVPV